MRTKDGSYPVPAPARAARLKEDAPKPAGRPSSLLDTRVIYCGDCLEQLRKLPDACVDLIYNDPPFKDDHAVIVPLTMQEILDEQFARKLA
ncbi:MAG TPA: hypothetical protein VMU04_22095 [Candidatus Acidoferrum sp.]|nr:hypothetical protein [Candidatus Acidoferrum sp.]